MKVTLHLEGTKEAILKQIGEFVNTIGAETNIGEAAPAVAPKKRKKKEEVVEDAEEELDLGDDSDAEEVEEDAEEAEQDEAEEDFEDAEDDDKLSEEELKKLKKALHAYGEKNGKGKAVKLLMKFGKTSSEVSKSDLPKLMKLLK